MEERIEKNVKKKNSRRNKKIRSLIVLCTFTAIFCGISTYAWFIGMRSVAVSSFDVDIATTDSLLLSFDGKKWATQVNINKSNFNDDSVVYAGNTNSWGGENGLIPMSTVGAMDSSTSRMVLFEKASFTATKGGYRVMASKVDNSASEKEGYVVFDLFVKNFSGTQYLANVNELDEEAIYLTTDSKATVSANGGKDGTGIENSVRVAFTQIGRTSGANRNSGEITAIKCTDIKDAEGNIVSTGICRKAQIWEPNDTAHVESAINWYKTACKIRKSTGTNIASDDAYESTNCVPIENGVYSTYAVNSEIASSDHVDVYDGADLNTYTGSTKLTDFPYFTDTMMNLKGVDRPSFMTLAPNSITKLRVYVYIEGQDIDNYDFASIGKKISVNFGFTKERFEKTDVSYTGPSFNVPAPSNNIVDDFSQN